MLTVREINRLVSTGKPVIAIYVEGTERQGRIIRARLKGGVLQGKTLNTGMWVDIRKIWQA